MSSRDISCLNSLQTVIQKTKASKMYYFTFSLISFLFLINLFPESNAISVNVKAVFPSNPSNAKRFPRIILDGTLPNMNEMTVCNWVNAHVIKPKGVYIVSYAHGQAADEILTGVGPIGNKTKLLLSIANQTSSVTTEKFRVGKWHFLCFSWSSGDGQTTTYLDGELIGKNRNILARGQIRSGGVLMIGQDQDVYNGKFDLGQSWEGYISNVQIWDEALKSDQIVAMSRCQLDLEGNVFAWMKTPVSALEGVGFSGAQICEGSDHTSAKRHLILN